jgi:hypothetical protein
MPAVFTSREGLSPCLWRTIGAALELLPRASMHRRGASRAVLSGVRAEAGSVFASGREGARPCGGESQGCDLRPVTITYRSTPVGATTGVFPARVSTCILLPPGCKKQETACMITALWLCDGPCTRYCPLQAAASRAGAKRTSCAAWDRFARVIGGAGTIHWTLKPARRLCVRTGGWGGEH